MFTRRARPALILIAASFFSALAMDIAVPALCLSLMMLSVELVSPVHREMRGERGVAA